MNRREIFKHRKGMKIEECEEKKRKIEIFKLQRKIMKCEKKRKLET